MADVPEFSDLTWRPLSTQDVDLWHALYDAARAADDGQEFLTTEDLGDELDAEWVDLEQDSVLGVDADGVARAFGLVQVRPGDTTVLRAHLWGAVHPDVRGRGVGRALLAWQERAAARVVAARRAGLDGQVPAYAWLQADEHVEAVGHLAGRAGYRLARWFSVMRRDLETDLPQPPAPAGVRVVPWSPELDDAVRLAHNEAFLDHWGFQPWSQESWSQWESGYRWFRKDWTLVALDGDQVAGYATGAGYEPDWEQQGFTEGWTAKLGVRRPWRGTGLGRHLLCAQMAAFRESGMRYAGLDVDSENLSGAVRLYEGLGYEPVRRGAQWAKDL